MGQTKVRQSVLGWEELDEILARHLPEEELSQVRATVRQLSHGGEAAFWKVRDAMTGMYNPEGLLQVLDEWKRECLASGEKLLLLCVNVDRLDNINLIYGHSEGDAAIRKMAQMLEDVMADDMVCGRLGSGEFVVAMRAAGDDAGRADLFFHDLDKSVENYNRLSGKEYSLHAIHSLWSGELREEDQVQTILDLALSERRKYFESRLRFIADNMEWPVDYDEQKTVQEAIEQNLFCYAYQPIVDAKSGAIYGYEALMRASRNISLPPMTILHYAGLENRLYDIEKAAFFNVLEQVKELQLGSRKLFINSIPGNQLGDSDYEELRSRFGDVFSNLVVEITEQTELTDDRMKILLQRSKEDGFALAIDDYGTGYSNTSSLLRFLPNCVKIDRLLIAEIQENPQKQHFVNNIITFAHENGILALAEGVETAAELKAVIRMGIDLIQGFYTGRPDFELLQELDRARVDEIVSANISLHNHIQRNIYIASDEREISLMRLALEQYTGIVVSQPEIILLGNPEYLAGMSIKVKDGCKCKITLRDVWLESIEDMPCIDVGNDSELTLVLKGTNVLEKVGIRVPDGSSCHIMGSGSLEIRARGIRCYGIGNDLDSGVGAITCTASGRMVVSTDGNQCVAIGGGIYRKGQGIRILGGKPELVVTGVEGIGVGCMEGDMPIELRDCSLKIDFRVAKGNAIGAWKADQNISISNMKLEINGSGSSLCGVGSIERTGGKIQIRMVDLWVRLTGQNICLVGNEGGGVEVIMEHSGVKLIGEGNNLVGAGSREKDARVEFYHVTLEIDLRASETIAIGAQPEACVYEYVAKKIWINEDH